MLDICLWRLDVAGVGDEMNEMAGWLWRIMWVEVYCAGYGGCCDGWGVGRFERLEMRGSARLRLVGLIQFKSWHEERVSKALLACTFFVSGESWIGSARRSKAQVQSMFHLSPCVSVLPANANSGKHSLSLPGILTVFSTALLTPSHQTSTPPRCIRATTQTPNNEVLAILINVASLPSKPAP